MEEYYGKLCPYCKTEIGQNDSVVVCSACGMPHHKECWIANQGCTTFGCMGTIESTDNNIDNADEDFIIEFEGEIVIGNTLCPGCGTLNKKDNLFCFRCGRKLK